MEFSRQEYWSGLPCPSPGYLPNPGMEPGSPALQVDSDGLWQRLHLINSEEALGMGPGAWQGARKKIVALTLGK